MKKLLCLLSFCMLMVSTHAYLPLKKCTNPSGSVSANYTACLNDNFAIIANRLESTANPYCFAVGSRVYHLANCINEALFLLEEASGGLVYTKYCHNRSEYRMNASFVRCVQRNFDLFSTTL